MNSHIFRLLTLTFLSIISTSALAQKEAKLYDKAEEKFSAHLYEDALNLYREASEENARFEDVDYKLEICLLLTSAGDDRSLDRFLSFENTYGRSDDLYFYWLGKIFTRRYMIEEAIKAFERFQQKTTYSGSSDEDATQDLIAHSLRLKEYFENPDNYEIHQLPRPVNSDSAELSPVFFEGNDELLFTSNRSGSGQTPFKVYYTRKSNDQWSAPVEVNTLGAFTRSNANMEVVNEDGKLFIFREEKGGDLYYSEPNGSGEWSEPVEFDARVSNNHIASHFFINEHEDRIIFASDENDRGLDIYESFKDPENGKWSKPQPFFSTVNSAYNEDSPYLSPDESKLYFCSDRPGGVGGYDVYVSEFNADNYTWTEPVNLGWPINSPDDEFHFKLNADQKSGCLVSKRLHTTGDFDIYSFWEIEKVKVQGRIFDQSTQGPLINAEIRFHPSQYLDEYFRSSIDQTGRYSTQIIANETFKVEILQDGAVIYEEEFEVHDTDGAQTTHIKDFTVN